MGGKDAQVGFLLTDKGDRTLSAVEVNREAFPRGHTQGLAIALAGGLLFAFAAQAGFLVTFTPFDFRKNARFLDFFLNRRRADSMDSFSPKRTSDTR